MENFAYDKHLALIISGYINVKFSPAIESYEVHILITSYLLN